MKFVQQTRFADARFAHEQDGLSAPGLRLREQVFQ